jgi:hypothetical protein
MCSGRNGLGGNPVTSTAPGLRLPCTGMGDSVQIGLADHLGSTGRLINGIGGRSL